MPDFKTLDDVKEFLDEQNKKAFGNTAPIFDESKGLLPGSGLNNVGLIARQILREHILDTSGGLEWQFLHATKGPAEIFYVAPPTDIMESYIPQITKILIDRQTREVVADRGV